MAVDKTFVADSLQNITDIQNNLSVTFQLLKSTDGENWVAATENDLSSTKTPSENPNNITVTLSGFSASNMKASSPSYSLKTYETDAEGTITNTVQYKWVETTISVNGVTGTMGADGKTIVVNNGQVEGDETKTSAPGCTTAIFESTSTGNSFTNTLVGTHKFEIDKYWYGADGKSLVVNKDPLGEDDPLYDKSAKFQIYRDGVAYGDPVVLTNADFAEPINGGDNFWQKILDLPRYDENGREYRYTVKEVGTAEGWISTANYEVSVVNVENVLIKKTKTVYVNSPGTGESLVFEVQKEWVDGSDLASRYPVSATLYRIKDADGNTLEKPVAVRTVELDDSNNWYYRLSIAKEGNDTVDNYVIVEDGIDVGGTVVPVVYSVAFKDIAHSGSTDIGTVGSTTAEGDSWDGLYYIYRVQETSEMANGIPSYTLRNIRTGKQILYFTKTWNAAGIVNGCVFTVENNNANICNIKIVAAADGKSVQDVLVKWAGESDYSTTLSKNGVTISYEAGKANDSGNYAITIKVAGLEKYDIKGELVTANITEIAMINKAGTEVEVKDNTAVIDGVTYTVTANKAKRGTIDDKQHHNSPDEYDYSITNTRSATIDLTANKVWRDNGTLVRPDISFALYSISAKDHKDLIGATGDELATKIASYKSSWNKVIDDYLWNTNAVERNEYWWTCSIKNVPQYDSEGYPLIYFGVEKASASVYKTYYCNQTGVFPSTPSTKPYTTMDVFGVPTEDLTPSADSVFIIADGINVKSDFQPNYSATVVNIPQIKRDVYGEKLWKTPIDWSIDSSKFPVVTVALYRTTTEMPADITGADAYKTWLLANAEKDASGNPVKLATQELSSTNAYKYNFEDYDKYDSWGSLYYYYVLEDNAELHNYPLSKVEYDGPDMYFANVFSSTPPNVEVSVTKTWYVDADWIAKMQSCLITGLDALDMPEVTFHLYSQATQTSDGTTTTIGSKAEIGSVVLSPSGGTGITIEQTEVSAGLYKVKATYTFKTFTNSITLADELLPYYGPNNEPLQYSITETSTASAAYHQEAQSKNMNIQLDPVSDVLYTNAATVDETGFVNKYENNTTLSFTKNWDEDADNTEYRPDAVRFLIQRTPDSTDKTYTDSFNSTTKPVYVILTKTNSVNWTASNLNHIEDKGSYYILSTAATDADKNLLKYAPDGTAYTYKIISETFLIEDSSGSGTFSYNGKTYATIGPVSTVGATIGKYKLESVSNNKFVNELREDIKTSVEVSKTWKIDGSDILFKWQQFSNLRDLGCFPDSVQYVVQRRVVGSGTEDSWVNVLASDAPDAGRIITIDGSRVLGYETNINSVDQDHRVSQLNIHVKWINLPTETATSTSEHYEYRVVEKLIWKDRTDTLVASGQKSKGIEATLTSTTSEAAGTSTSITNEIRTVPVKFVKVWNDNNGYDYIRPETITLSITPETTNGKTMEFTLAARATEAGSVVYESEEFYIDPARINATDKYTITETLNYPSDMLSFDYSAYIGTDAATGTLMTHTAGTKVYTATNVPGNVAFTSTGSGSFKVNIFNTETHTRKTINLEASKVWSGDDKWKDVTRPDVYFKIQYREQNTADSWKDITDMSQFSSAEILPAAVQKVYDAKTGELTTASWTGMFKYWKPNTIDGVAELIQYRVVECLDAAGTTIVSTENSDYKPDNAIKNFTLTNGTTSDSKTITNTYQKKNITVTKKWSETKNFDLKYLRPTSVKFELQYSTDNGTTWNYFPADVAGVSYADGKSYVVVNNYDVSLKDASGSATIADLPVKAANGNEIKYKATEVSITYSGDPEITVNADTVNGTVGPYGIDVDDTLLKTTNSVPDASLTISKAFTAEDNRDNRSVTIALIRDGVTVDTYVLDKSNNWSKTYGHLPLYKNTATAHDDANRSVYQVVELAVSGYTLSGDPIYSLNGGEGTTTAPEFCLTQAKTVTLGITNKYVPDRGTVVAAKQWDDIDDAYHTRPTSINLKLQYSVDNGSTWLDIEKSTLDADNLYPSGDKAYTTSNVIQTVSDIVDDDVNLWGNATWEKLPVNILVNGNSQKVIYRVVEIVDDSTAEIIGYKSAASANITLSKDGTQAAIVKNTLNKKDIEVKKTWNSTPYDAGIVSVKFELKYSTDGGTTWTNLPNTTDLVSQGVSFEDGHAYVSVTEAVNWSKQITGLPEKNSNGDTYTYKAFEVSITYKDSTGKEVTVNTASGADTVGPYTITYNGTTVNNTTDKGSLKIDKTFIAENNRDNKEAVVDIYRDGVLIETGVVLNQANSWSVTYTNLPLYKNNAEAHNDANKSVYKVVETNASEFTAVTYKVGNEPAVTEAPEFKLTKDANVSLGIENTYTPQRQTLSATKTWVDNEDYNVRPQITLTLQYRYKDAAGNWQIEWTNVTKSALTNNLYPDGTNAYTTSDVSQILTKDNVMASDKNKWGTAKWENLPVYILDADGNRQEIYYQVLETVLSGYDTTYIDNEVTLVNGDKSVVVQNKVKETEYSVRKTWQDNKDFYQVRPEKIVVMLQYSADDGKSWSDLGTIDLTGDPTALEWSYTWTNLRADLKYRAYEKAVIFGDSTLDVIYTAPLANDDEFYAGKSGSYSVLNSFGDESVEIVNSIPDTVDSTTLKVEKKWVDEDNREVIRPSQIELTLYRTNGGTDKQLGKPVTVTPDEKGYWSYEWHGLPKVCFVNGQFEDCVYKVTETAIGEYTTSYSSEAIVMDGAKAAELTVTNTHETLKRTITATKDWTDYDSKLRPVTIEFTLLYSLDGETWSEVGQGSDYSQSAIVCPEGSKQTVTIGTGAEYAVWTQLPVYANVSGVKTAVQYKVEEAEVEEYYAPVYSPATVSLENEDATIKVTNPAEGTFTAVKLWDDNNDFFKLRPDSITYQLQYNNNGTWADYGKEKTAAKADEYKCVWENLPKHEYRAVEISLNYGDTAVPAESSNYTVSYENSENGTTITNAIPGTLKVTKFWDDSNNADGSRPTSITIDLYRDGKKVDSHVFTGDMTADNWEYTWTNLPLYQSATSTELSEYKVVENVEDVTIPGEPGEPFTKYYEIEYSANGGTYSADCAEIKLSSDTPSGAITVKNTHLTYLQVSKTWVNCTKTPDVLVQLQSRLKGSADAWAPVDGKTVTLNADNSWSYKFDKLSQRYEYRAVEVDLTYADGSTVHVNDADTDAEDLSYIVTGPYPGFVTSCVTETVGEGADLYYNAVLTNSQTKLEVSKTWVNCTKTPDVEVQLQSRLKGSSDAWKPVENATATLNEKNNWKYTFNELSPAYEYRAVETKLVYADGTTIDVNKPNVAEEDLTNIATADPDPGFVTSSVTETVGEGADLYYNAVLTNSQTKLEATKSWSNTETKPNVVIQLQYRKDSNDTWKIVPRASATLTEAMGWTYTFEELSPAFEYRAVEVDLVYATGNVIHVCDSDTTAEDLSRIIAGNLLSGFITSAITEARGVGADRIYICALSNTYFYNPPPPQVTPPIIIPGQKEKQKDKIIEEDPVPKAKLPSITQMGDVSLLPFEISSILSAAGAGGAVTALLKGKRKKTKNGEK